jgi:serine protease Do
MAIHGFGEIAEKLRRSTVLIRHGTRGNGSGVIWSADGSIITNAHVARASQMQVQLWDGREFDAALISRDTRRDLAELRISATNLPAADASDSSQVRPGELAIAIGNPLGFVGALTTGVIHAVGPLRRLGSARRRPRPRHRHQHHGRRKPRARRAQQRRREFSRE